MEEDKGGSTAAMEVEDAGGVPAGSGDAWELLSMARQLVGEGKASLALQAVVMAMKSEGGQQAVFETLHRARELYRSRLQANAAADELASLFAECAIAEAKPAASNPPPSNMVRASLHLQESADNSILAMSGRKQIMLDAFADGSSFICLQCGGLVSNLRKDEHQAYWCD
ncbi:uncharacterized protein LOC120262945 [Dioscorea cayenensis subsp. rotundata]|uniref:Uncharacterized protein LOC120262945 n=1 Tax=Dioscorea cayennensis subsp. rotundata TaxID=55577 RepID=A0AB40BHD8_DIOCR|nr:uncharacterized protein LOC120262945 [Dioscorea cayenensis subsp. rotundata]